MKKALIVTTFFFAFIILYFIQTNFFTWYNIGGIKPNLFIIYSLFIGLFLGKNFGFCLGAFLGICLDLFIGKRIGINVSMLLFAGFLGGILDKSFSKESRITFMTMTFVVTIACEILSYILQIVVLNSIIDFSKFIEIVIVEAIYNSILVIILYPLIQKAGNKTEEIINERKTLMRYY